MFQGAIVAIVTPFKNGTIDEESYRALIEFQIENGTSAIVPVGTTGESATLTFEEHHQVIKICIVAIKKILMGYTQYKINILFIVFGIYRQVFL